MLDDRQHVLDHTPEDRERLGRAALDWVLQYFEGAGAQRVYPAAGAAELERRLSEPLPARPQDPARVLEDFAAIAGGARHNAHPRMFGYVQSSGNFAGVVGDLLASALNQNVTSWRSAPAATTIELQVVEWIKAFVGVEEGAGILLSGGSAANLAGVACALRASTEADVGAHGVRVLPGAPRVYASTRVHVSIPKAAAMLGLGRGALVSIDTTPDGRMDPAALRDRLEHDRQSGLHQVCVIASAGEVNTGAIDPLDDIADICRRAGVWMHVDASYGGFAAAVPSMREALAALRRADSLSLDPHKWLFAPLDAGCLLVRDERRLRQTFSQGAAYIDVLADRDMSEFAFWDVGPELSRRFRALKLWFAFKCYGAEAFAETIARNLALAQHLGALVDASGDFERVAPVPLSIVCFRLVPAALRGNEPELNAFNARLLLAVQRGGRSYVSNATIGDTFALRACIVNHRTTERDVEQLLDDVRDAARSL